jgi:hypothetical protein
LPIPHSNSENRQEIYYEKSDSFFGSGGGGNWLCVIGECAGDYYSDRILLRRCRQWYYRISYNGRRFRHHRVYTEVLGKRILVWQRQ